MQVYDSVDSIKWSRPKGRLYILAKRGSRDLRKLLWMLDSACLDQETDEYPLRG